MHDYALMCFLFLLMYVLISNNHCKFLTNSKKSKSNDTIHILIANKREEKMAFVSINKSTSYFFLKGILKMKYLENKINGNSYTY